MMTEDRVKTSTLEEALLFLAGQCDGASSKDGVGFNGADTKYGHWLADQVAINRTLSKRHARSALLMIQKYRKQLAKSNINLPVWEDIESDYTDEIQQPKLIAIEVQPTAVVEEKPDRRIELIGNQVAIFSPYDPSVVSAIKAIDSPKKFNGSDKGWYFPFDAAEILIAEFSDWIVDETLLQSIEDAKAEELRKAVEKAEGIIQLIEAANLDSPLPNGKTLYKHQKEGIQWLLAHRKDGIYGGGILADDMGLGKTLQLLIAAKAMRLVYGCPVFVICPATLKDNWLREAEEVGVEIEVFSWAKQPKPLEYSEYVVIGDEAHAIQAGVKSNRGKAMLELTQHKNCIAAWMATATPMKNGIPINLFPLLQVSGHPIGKNKSEYERYFCNARMRVFGRREVWDNTGAAHLDELSKKTEDVILRRTKKECLDLPPKIRQLLPVELSSAAEKIYNAKLKALVDNYKERLKAGLISNEAEALVALGQLRLAGSVAKVEAAIELAKEILEQGNQVVLFTEFSESALMINSEIGGELLTGATPIEERQSLVDRFQSGQSKVFVSTIKAGGVGITLTAASYVILVDRAWTPGDTFQAEDRLYRIGQKQTVNVIWLQYGQVDQGIDGLLQQKQDRIELVLKGKRKTLRGIGSPVDLAKELLKIL